MGDYSNCVLSSSTILAGTVAAAAAKSHQWCPTLCDSIDSSPPGSPVLGFSRQEHWSGFPFPSLMHESEKWKWRHSVVSDLTAAFQAPLSMGFSRQGYWSGVPLPSLTCLYCAILQLIILLVWLFKSENHENHPWFFVLFRRFNLINFLLRIKQKK